VKDVANITQTFAVRDSTATPAGKRLTGLSPAWAFFVNLTTGVAITPPPTIVEVGGGQYRFSYDPEANGEAAGQINAMPTGTPLTAESDQYIDMVATRDSSRILTALPPIVAGAVGGLPTISQVTYAGGGTGPALAGVQLASSERLAIQGDVATSVSNIPASQLTNIAVAVGALVVDNSLSTAPITLLQTLRYTLATVVLGKGYSVTQGATPYGQPSGSATTTFQNQAGATIVARVASSDPTTGRPSTVATTLY